MYIYDSQGHIWVRSSQHLNDATCTECLDEINLSDMLYREELDLE